ncbi:MAG: NTP transferase domain-containing protein [Theionarchaea archaeon]|nr:NTP transferase domain-containing protein [Theionarchaea archaeon]MBU7041104.1 NTP transferase domain-containing protein [Theionarchaea archaeon]
MKVLIMAGGKGERLTMGEKPLLSVGGTPMIKKVIDSVKKASIGEIIVAVSENTPETGKFIESEAVQKMVTAGRGYIEDMREVIREKNISEPVLVLSSDVPLITPEILNDVVTTYETSNSPALAVYTTKDFCEKHGIFKKELLSPSGINIVSGAMIMENPDNAQEEEVMILNRIEVALNVNTIDDIDTLQEYLTESV